MVPDPSLTPEMIQARTFTSGFRGYDHAEVRDFLNRLSAEVRALRERAEQLESAWRSAEERAARPPVLDEDTLMAAVGEETAAILRSARAAAQELRGRAAEESERALASAQEEADKITAEAETVLADERKAAEEAAEGIAEAARVEAAEMLDRARAEAEALRAKAEQERALTIEGANSTRERILEDLSRRRRVATVQIEQLRAGRERLLEAYAIVRKTLEEAQEDLTKADAEARAAADEVGRRFQRDPHEVEAAIEAVAAEGALIQPEAVRELSPADETGTVVDTGLAVDIGPATEAGSVVEKAPATASASAVKVATAEKPASRRSAKGNPVDQLFARIRAGNDDPAPAGDAPPRNGTSNGHGGAVTEEQDEAVDDARPEPHEATDTEGRPGVGQGLDAPAETEKRPGMGQGLDAPAETEERPGVGQGLNAPAETEGRPGVGQGPHAPEEDGVGAPSGPNVTEGLLQRREGQLVDLETSLTRKLKRALQDEQNDLLDRLRGLRGELTPQALLPDLEHHTTRYSKATTPLLEQAASAGAAFAGEVLGADPAGNKPADGSVDISDLASDASSSIVGPLRRRLEQVITSGAGEEQSVLVESLGAAYREWKSQRIERVAGDVLSAAFSRGTWDATPDGTMFRWIVEDADGPCPDCDDDALAGDLPKGESFPTGQPYPPAHSGCRCLLVPVAG